jgi:hypothetical protein
MFLLARETDVASCGDPRSFALDTEQKLKVSTVANCASLKRAETVDYKLANNGNVCSTARRYSAAA